MQKTILINKLKNIIIIFIFIYKIAREPDITLFSSDKSWRNRSNIWQLEFIFHPELLQTMYALQQLSLR